jgi:hypothetical protein
VTNIKETLDVPRISWPADVTFDTKRRRVLLLASRILYAYEPASGVWSALTDGLSARVVTYSAKDDALYALQAEHERPASLLRLNASGAVVASQPLSGTLVPGLLSGQLPGPGGVQLIAVDGHLVLAATHVGPTSEDPPPRGWYLYIIDPQTARAKLTWKAR